MKENLYRQINGLKRDANMQEQEENINLFVKLAELQSLFEN